MDTFKSFASKIYSLNDQSFDEIALEIFNFQALHNPVYAAFIRNLGVKVNDVRTLNDIPYLPVSFFKTQTVQSDTWVPETFFTSSGTTGTTVSRHAVADLSFYQHHARKCFEFFFGPLEDYHFLALLPSYQERQGSSLIAMIDYFISNSRSPLPGYYLTDYSRLFQDLSRPTSQKLVLWGVSFALLDLVEHKAIDLSHCMIFETGGMKGRRKEITREELHTTLKNNFNVRSIYSEYGMTELFSQAYTDGTSRFKSPPWMKIVGRELGDPMAKGLQNETAGINVIDLANWQTISFIETEDVGKVYDNGTFEVLGRMDNSDIRGCNLMI